MPKYKALLQDNAHLSDKVSLRQAIIDEAGFKELHVLDAFAGGGFVWKKLQKNNKIGSYLPVDIHPKLPGTLRLDVNALTIAAFRPDNFNVVDLDCYDSRAWELLPHFLAGSTKPMAIFLTYGSIAASTRTRCRGSLRRQSGCQRPGGRSSTTRSSASSAASSSCASSSGRDSRW
jgi:hypothetical protein